MTFQHATWNLKPEKNKRKIGLLFIIRSSRKLYRTDSREQIHMTTVTHHEEACLPIYVADKYSAWLIAIPPQFKLRNLIYDAWWMHLSVWSQFPRCHPHPHNRNPFLDNFCCAFRRHCWLVKERWWFEKLSYNNLWVKINVSVSVIRAVAYLRITNIKK